MKGAVSMADPFRTVVIPGFGGTALSFSGGSEGKTNLWYNPPALLKYSPLSMALANDGNTPLPVFGRKLFLDGPVGLGVYEPLLTSLASDGMRPIFFPYDWRVSANVTANKLATFLATTPLTDPFYVVAHSFGGLIAQLAYPLYRLNPNAPTWATTAYLGTPHGGSYWAPAALAGLYTDGSTLLLLQSLFTQLSQVSFVTSGIRTAIAVALGTTVGSWPGLYALMPNSKGPWQGLDPLASQLLLLQNYANTPGGVQQQWLNLALALQQTLVDNYALPRPAEVSLVGDGFLTLDSVTDYANPGLLKSYKQTLVGDGTVSVQRGTVPGQSAQEFKRTGHTAIANSGGPLAMLKEYLLEPPTHSTVLGNSPTIPVPGNVLSTIPGTFNPPPVWVNRHNDP
jgi:pimeloyl-ACP methyl ester carboxylesterase